MSSYLQRLKQLDSESYSQHTLEVKPPKLTEGAFGGFGSKDTGHVDIKISVFSNIEPTKPECMDTLAADYAELKAFIVELCGVVGHDQEAQVKMLAACRNIPPIQIAEQRNIFRQKIELANAGKYWDC